MDLPRPACLHKEGLQKHETHVALDFLPPYCPQPNPVERVWKLLRRICLHNEHFSDLMEVVAAVEPQLDAWSHPNDALRKLCDTFG